MILLLGGAAADPPAALGLLPTVDEFRAWAEGREQPKTTTMVYWRGNGIEFLPENKPAIMRAAWLAHIEGYVELVQRRLAPGQFSYIAQRKRRRAGK